MAQSKVDFSGIKRRIPAAIARALNRSIESAKTAMNRAIAQDMGLKVSTVSDLIRVERATEDQRVARLYASFKRIPLIDFNARGPEPSRGKGRGVTARMPGGLGRYPNAFIATMRSGHRGVFTRRSAAGRLPIAELRGPSIGHVFVKHKAIGEARGQEQLAKNLASEFRFALSRT